MFQFGYLYKKDSQWCWKSHYPNRKTTDSVGRPTPGNSTQPPASLEQSVVLRCSKSHRMFLMLPLATTVLEHRRRADEQHVGFLDVFYSPSSFQEATCTVSRAVLWRGALPVLTQATLTKNLKTRHVNDAFNDTGRGNEPQQQSLQAAFWEKFPAMVKKGNKDNWQYWIITTISLSVLKNVGFYSLI